MNVSFIIVNYNTANLLINCIKSIIEKTTDLIYEIIVVDNNSNDESVALIRKNFPNITLIQNKKNIGFGRANNLGAKVAKGKYLFLLNSDTMLINNAAQVLFNFMESGSSNNIGACGGNLFTKDMHPNFSYGNHFPSLWRMLCYRGHIHLPLFNDNWNKTQNHKDVAFIIGADLFISKKIFDSLEGFDQNIFMYIEDLELQYRISKLNFRIVSNPEAKICHMQGASSQTIFKLKTEIESYSYFFKKHTELISLTWYKKIEIFFLALKALVFVLKKRREKAKAYLSIIQFVKKI